MMKNLLGRLEAATDQAVERQDRELANVGFKAQEKAQCLSDHIEYVIREYRYQLDRAESDLAETEDPLRAAEKLMELIQRMNQVPVLDSLMTISARAITAVEEAKEAGLLESLADFIPNEA